MDSDCTSWCPACDRQIMPKTTLQAIPQPAPPPPPPPPSSPQSLRKTKGGRGGLAQGTGRVKPNGAIKRPAQPQPQVKHRLVIDQGPTPLYCSDECRMADIHSNHGALPINYNPDRQSMYSPASYSCQPTDCDSSSSIESQSSISSNDSQSQSQSTTPMSPSLATLAAIYNFPPLPPPPPVDEVTSVPDSRFNDYSSGVMMAARRIAELCPKPQKRNAYGHIISPTGPREPIPGWTDGSNAWRSSVYSFASPRNTPGEESKAYKSFAASSHRSQGVRSTLTASSSASYPSRSTSSLPLDNNEMITKFSQSFNRRSDSRVSLYPSPPSPSVGSFPSTAPKRERNLLQPGAEGKLLVPDVKMKVHSGSSPSLSSAWSGSSSRRSSCVRSPLSLTDSSDEDDHRTQRSNSTVSLPHAPKRPTVETRSWSYDNIKTYPIMRLPPKKEKRMEKQIVDGVETEVEIEVIVEEPMKRLFLFPPSTRT